MIFVPDIPLGAAPSLVFSVAIFPQYTEFTGIARTLAGEGVVKVKAGNGLDRFFPLFSLFTVLLAAPLLILFVSPQFFIGALVGIIVGFSGFQIAFTVYIRNWEQGNGVRVSRYALVSEDERGRRVVHEYGLRAERSRAWIEGSSSTTSPLSCLV